MIHIDDILEENLDIFEYLSSRQILEQYKKSKSMLLAWFPQKYDFKLRKPKIEWIYQFRINQKYRAFWVFKKIEWKNIFVVYKISDHQDF